MKRTDNKSHCPVNFALETFGDPWSLLIVRDIVFWGKRTYGEFLESGEGISTNVLAARLAHLEQRGILAKGPHPADGRKDVYALTEKGIALIPLLLEMCGWSAVHDPQTTAPMEFVQAVYADRETMFTRVQDAVRAGGSLFGPQALVKR
ncbi:MAG TPA: helix-turn-helix domain-containing protein [Noviherbaspirillum sp.]|uniref:winged helix-turn-helix transcriptional regulator n=1 Tax=Noviherbaspirillum sp. TaxID=1926288 RepID=UPI002D7201F7|nr:helix-turn-helix domain-containing protein [Noviherbaspirillum sp.]HYD94171.1 helix-turn-helix domain-containing protein [Noviherbaspirillum sp.]